MGKKKERPAYLRGAPSLCRKKSSYFFFFFAFFGFFLAIQYFSLTDRLTAVPAAKNKLARVHYITGAKMSIHLLQQCNVQCNSASRVVMHECAVCTMG